MTAAYRVFSQSALDPASLIRGAQGLGRGLRPPLELAVQGAHPSLALPDPQVFLGVGMEAPFVLLQATRGEDAASYRLLERLPTEEDWAAARRAEAASQAHGMADLARRCTKLWELHPLPPVSADLRLTLLLCAVAASVALGPVLPEDEASLFGVRGARLRAGC